MRAAFSIVFFLVIIFLVICAVIAAHSKRGSSRQVSRLLLALIPPVIGNLIIVYSGNKTIALAGCYIYFLGMDVIMITLAAFTMDYCKLTKHRKQVGWFLGIPILIDIVQYALNPIFHNAFKVAPVIVDGYAYYKLVPLAGQIYHRVLDYAIFFSVLIIFAVKAKKASKIYSERYTGILASMIIVGGWQTFYIFTRSAIDRSMIGYGVFGFLVFYFTCLYRPVKLLDSMLANIASEMPDAVFLYDNAEECIWANEQGAALLDLAPGGDDFKEVGKRLPEKFGQIPVEGDWVAERILGRGEDTRYYTLDHHAVGRDGSFLLIHDSTEEKQELRTKIYNSTHDAITGVYTREHLYEWIRDELKMHPGERYCIIHLDVDDFKLANDIFGTEFGDRILVAIADWIRGSFGSRARYGRLFGDKFGICLPEEDLDTEKLEQDLSVFTVEQDQIRYALSVRIGIYRISDPELEVSVMFDRAHMALQTIKDNVHQHIAYYDEEIRRKALWERNISIEVQKAIEGREICPYLQALVDREGKIVGAEALVRWFHSEKGFLLPGLFLPVLEKNGLISRVDRYMWRSACEILSRWDNDLFISVNISPKDFYFMDVAAKLKGLVEEFGISPKRLRLEITETVMMSDIENRMKILNELREYGFIIEMDDFGSGYSSLNLLKDMPVDVIKIDMAFLRESRANKRTETILRSIIHMSEELGMVSLTEGVETEAQYKALSDMGCRMFQGFYFTKPMPVADFEREWVA